MSHGIYLSYDRVAIENDKTFSCSVSWHQLFNYDDGSRIEICNNSTLGSKANERSIHSKDTPISKDLIPCAKFNIIHVNLGTIDKTTHVSIRKMKLSLDFIRIEKL